MLVDLPAALVSLLLVTCGSALPAQPKRRAASPVQWASIGPNFYLPGRPSSSSSTSPTLSLSAVPTPTLRAKVVALPHGVVNPKVIEKRIPSSIDDLDYGSTSGVVWYLATSIQDVAVSLLSQYYATATSTTASASPTAPSCRRTIQCRGLIELPGYSHNLCHNGACVFACDSGYKKTADRKGCEPRPVTTTTSTTTSTLASPTGTPTCKKTIDCRGRVTPPLFAHNFCDAGLCTFACNTGYVLNGAATGCLLAPTTTTTTASASQTGSSGLGDGTTFWNLKATFTSITSFVADSKLTSWAWGQANVRVVQGVPNKFWRTGVQESNNGSAIQVTYPAGSYSPGHSPNGGVGLYTNSLDVTQANNVSFAYSVFFPRGFDFVQGGKLPGLYGGRKACSGGDAAENCFSTRLMFRTGGLGELYLYAPREKQVRALCTLKPLSFCNTYYGMSIGRGSWTFRTGEWTNIRQDIWLNTPGKADGGFNIWVNDKLVLHSDVVYYRNSPLGNLGNGTATEPITLINYDALPPNIIIPNGGFQTYPVNVTSTTTTTSATPTFSISLVTKIVGTGVVTDTEMVTVEPTDWENRRRRRSVALAAPTPTTAPSPPPVERRYEPVEDAPERFGKRAALPIGFLGMKFDTFFGGSTALYAPSKTQYTFFNQFGLRIRS